MKLLAESQLDIEAPKVAFGVKPAIEARWLRLGGIYVPAFRVTWLWKTRILSNLGRVASNVTRAKHGRDDHVRFAFLNRFGGVIIGRPSQNRPP
jgi:hypothetical protein